MLKTLSMAILCLLTLSLLTACDSSGGGGNPADDSIADNTPAVITGAPASDAPREIRTPDVSVNPGDTIFDNEYMKLVFDGLNKNKTFINCRISGKATEPIWICADAEPFIINGIATDYRYIPFMPMRPYKEGDTIGSGQFGIMLVHLENAYEMTGISPDDLKTVQATITIVEPESQATLFEITVLFNFV